MQTNNNRKNAHDMIDRIFHELLLARDMTERPEQVSLSHLMLDSMLNGSIALCDAGTGIGKTYSYLAAGAAFLCFQAANGLKFRPIIVSTSSIALQNAVQDEYLPLLSDVLMEDGLMDQPLRAVIRKGKSHYVCDHRLERRLGQLDLSKKTGRLAGLCSPYVSIWTWMPPPISATSTGSGYVFPKPAIADGRTADTLPFWRNAVKEAFQSKSAITTCFWQTPSTMGRAERLFCQTPAPSSSTKRTSCLILLVRCSVPR